MRFSAKFVKQVFKVIHMKKLVGQNMVDPPPRLELNTQQLKRSQLPQRQEIIGESDLITLFPVHPTTQHVFYLHGGGYALEASPFHKKIQAYFVSKYGLKVSAFDYPLAPEHTAEVTLRETLKAFQRLVFLYPDDQFYLFGDSAGGGLALSLAQHLRDLALAEVPVGSLRKQPANSATSSAPNTSTSPGAESLSEAGLADLRQTASHRPQKLALISPWLDLTLQDPRIAGIENRDVLLERDLLAEAAANYAGDLALTDPRVSPLFGELTDLGALLVISGTDDILNPDVLNLEERLQALGSPDSTGTQLTLSIAPEMMHDFVVYPLKESAPYLDLIGNFYTEK